MKQKISALVFILAFCIPFTGCNARYPAKIEQPVEGNLDTPVTEFRVKLHEGLVPNSFAATLDDVPYPHPFTPLTPGGTATAPAVEFSRGKHTFKAWGNISPSEPGDARYALVEFTPPPLELSGQDWPSPASANCSTPCYIYRDRTVYTGPVPVQETQSKTVTALSLSAPATPLTVTITPSNNRVSLNNQSAGASITVVIPTNDRRADFTVRGIQQGAFELKASAPGFQSDTISWSVH